MYTYIVTAITKLGEDWEFDVYADNLKQAKERADFDIRVENQSSGMNYKRKTIRRIYNELD